MQIIIITCTYIGNYIYQKHAYAKCGLGMLQPNFSPFTPTQNASYCTSRRQSLSYNYNALACPVGVDTGIAIRY